MASIWQVYPGMGVALGLGHDQQSPDVSTSAAGSDVPPGSGDTVPEPYRLPDIASLDWQREGMPDTEFNRKYPPDAWGEEAAPNARVWKIYRDQQDLSHNGILEGWNKTLDVLLIFAGLFSAVLTAFLIESYKALQPDYAQYMAAFLYAAAVSHNRTGGVLPALDSIVAPDRFIQTSRAQRWTNGLWFSSLVISLAVALLCILIKQWLDAYDAHVSAAAPSSKHWAQRHSLYHHGLKKWGVPKLISFLPLLLHLSLFLFFAGLILFLHPLDGAISNSLLVLVSCIGAFYILSLVLPGLQIDCPSYTPLLAQAQLAVSRVISGMLYVMGPRYGDVPFWRRFTLTSWTVPVEDWLYSVQPRVGQQLVRETAVISERALHLDGQVLSALIHLPTDIHRDTVNTAFAATGAITSTHTIDVISRKVPDDVFWDKLDASLRSLPSPQTGFEITSRAQLHRAFLAKSIQPTGTSNYMIIPPYVSSLGIDGLLLQGLRIEDADRQHSGIDLLIGQLQSLPLGGDSSRGYPLRSTCLLFLDYFAQGRVWNPSLGSHCLLIFCAGRFASADMHELVRALRSIETILSGIYSITIRAHNGQDNGYVRAVVDSMWLMLADSTRCNIDTLTAQIVARHALACFDKLSRANSGVSWSQLSCLATFTRSPIFSQCMAAADNLNEYVRVLSYGRMRRLTEEPLDDYWPCIATLLKLTWECVPRPERAVYLCNPFHLLPVEPNDWDTTQRISKGGPYATQDDWYEPILSAILTGPNAIAMWTATNSPDHDDDAIIDLANLAHRISIALCRRQRLGRANDDFVPAFFSGSFLLSRVRDRVFRPRPIPGPKAWRYKLNYEQAVDDLAKHCLKLSPESFMAIMAQLEETGDVGSELRASATAFAQRLREGSMPGGDLSGECAADCPCMTPSARADAERGWGDVWNELVTRFRRGRGASATAEHV